MPIWDATAALWAGASTQEWAERLKAAFGESAPYWDQAGLMWGDYDKHCLELSTEDGAIEQFKLRIDLRSDDIAFVERVLSFARENDLLLLMGEGEPIDQNSRASVQHFETVPLRASSKIRSRS
jgi:hypothetical protein